MSVERSDQVSFRDRVGSALRENPYFSNRQLRFETDEGRVTLKGVVRSYFQKQMAQESITKIDGVHEIRNELTVQPVIPTPTLNAG